MMKYDKCPSCGKVTSDYYDYGVTYKICRICGWDERTLYIKGV